MKNKEPRIWNSNAKLIKKNSLKNSCFNFIKVNEIEKSLFIKICCYKWHQQFRSEFANMVKLCFTYNFERLFNLWHDWQIDWHDWQTVLFRKSHIINSQLMGFTIQLMLQLMVF